MEIVHERGQVTVSEVEAALPGNPANSTVRTLLAILERKGQLKREGIQKGSVLYGAADSHENLRLSALERLTRTLFKGSAVSVVAALVDGKDRISPEELAEIEELIKKAKEENR